MELRDFFRQHPRCALAFSGGADSAYLLYEGLRLAEALGAYYVRSAFQPEFEYRDALRLAGQLGAKLTVLELDVLADPRVSANAADRCYHCKKRILSGIRSAAARDGFSLLIDGTNASDEIGDRPGFRALGEQGVLSPLRLCGLTKAEIRARSKQAGLPTWDKPAYACLATRVRTGEAITREKLNAVEKSEDALFRMGFSDFRVRTQAGRAKLQFTAPQLEQGRARMDEIQRELGSYFTEIIIDPAAREASI